MYFQCKLYFGLAVLTTYSFAIHYGEYMEHFSSSQQAWMKSCELYILQEWGWSCGIFTSD